EGADVRQVGDGADVQQSAGDADYESGYPGRYVGSSEFGVNVAEDIRQQAVAGHGEPDARLAELKDENRGDHAQQCANEDKEPYPLQISGAGQQGELL